MEIEKEKRKIEFWSRGYCFKKSLLEHKPEKPFTKPVEVIFAITYRGDCDESRPSKVGLPIKILTKTISEALHETCFILNEKQITRIEIDKRESRTPGIAFFMQEVE